MNFDKLKNLFTRSINSTQQESFFDKAASIITSSRRSSIQNPTAQFQEYLQNLPIQEIKAMKVSKVKPTKIASLRPQLLVRCYQNVPKLYFDVNYSINNQLFTRNRKEVIQKTTKMHQHLDQVELCLFNQISSRFDEILSVLRTIESLECLVDYNSYQLKEIRSKNVTIVKNASERNIKIVRLLKKQERLKAVLQKMAQMRHYSSFIHLDCTNLKLQRTNSQRYQQVNQIRLRRDLYFQLSCTKKFEEKVEELESTLKKSYSDSINDAFFKYAIEIFPYDANFWDKKFMGKKIFQEEEPQEGQGTVILDESMLVQEQTGGGGGFNIKISDQREKQIVSNVVTGWREGEYSTGSIKAAFDKFIKQKHLRFNSDSRNFCFQAYLKEDKPKIDNPNLVNLMQQMNIFFVCKTSIFYADMYRGFLSRSFSLAHKIVVGMINESQSQLTIQQKQKISIVIDGVFSILAFIFKTVYEKIIETIDLKHIHDSMQLTDFKQLINLFQTQEDFIAKHIKRYIQFQSVETFLDPVLKNSQIKLDFQLIKRTKEEKVLCFLNRTHRYILQNQLRESFQNQIWTATDIPTFYYDSLHYLITGQSLNLRRNKNHTIRHNISNNFQSSMFIDRLGREASMVVQKQFIGNFRIIRNEIIINNKIYKVTQTLLLLLQIVQDYMHLAQFYPFAKKEVGQKIFELLRAYNISCHQLIILGGAVKLQKIKTKNITAKHLALSSLCLSFLIYIIDCIRTRIPINDQQRIRADLQNHDETTIKKLSSILSNKVAQAVGDINLVNVPSKGTESIVNSTKILHDILVDFYQKDILSRIFVRQNVVAYLNRLKSIEITSKMQAQSLKDDLNFYFHELRFLQNLISGFQTLRLQAEDIVRVKFEQL